MSCFLHLCPCLNFPPPCDCIYNMPTLVNTRDCNRLQSLWVASTSTANCFLHLYRRLDSPPPWSCSTFFLPISSCQPHWLDSGFLWRALFPTRSTCLLSTITQAPSELCNMPLNCCLFLLFHWTIFCFIEILNSMLLLDWFIMLLFIFKL